MTTPVKNIKEVIETLCQLMVHHGFTKISSETFRQGKFSKPEAAPCLLNLIYELLEFTKGNKSRPLTNKFLVLLFILKKLHYPRLPKLIYCKESDLSSKELLLVFGYLLIKLRICEKLLMIAENFVSACILQNSVEDRRSFEDHGLSKSKEYQLDSLIITRKKINFAFHGLISSVSYYIKMLKKYSDCKQNIISEELYERNIQKISMLDLLIQGNLKWQKEHISLVSKQNNLLKLHLKWIKCEAMFWQWMESVGKEDTNIHTESSNGITPYEKLILSFLFSEDDLFNDVLRYYGKNCYQSDKGINELYRTKEMFSSILRKRIVFTNTKTELTDADIVVQNQLNILQNQIKQIQQDNRVWLSGLLNTKYPDLVQLPIPRR